MASTTASRSQPPWIAPAAPSTSSSAPKLQIYNSLTRSKNEFYPIDQRGKKVTWYCCGPTVYDAGHLGHARNYVTSDILRRIMRDYFGYEVVFVQNVTDVDDKIILRARQGFLLDEFKTKYETVTDEVKAETQRAWEAYIAKNLPAAAGVSPREFKEWVQKTHTSLFNIIVADQERNLPGRTEQQREEAEHVLLDEKATKLKMHLTTLLVSSVALTEPAEHKEQFYAAAGPVLQGYLDQLPENRTRQYDHSIFSKLSAFWEAHFNEDMRRLNVLPPTITTRVSEFIPQNISFVEKLVEKGFAYQTADGSIYFDITAYEEKGHHYAKLEPWNKGNQGLIADGEGALAASNEASDSTASESGILQKKKSPADFAVWKASKAGEPGWESPWGTGRPGWHIECSVMCSEVLGGKIDIHSGGIDLAFPHHDNELAQSEAYWDDPCVNAGGERHQWINYFLHMGHLSIQGSKMSKSLKNFVSIREALAEGGGWTPRSLRIIFLLGGWKEGIEIGKDLIAEAKAWEARVNKFFSVVKALVAEEVEREKKKEFIPQPFGEREKKLMDELDAAQTAFHAHLCNSFTTSGALDSITAAISSANAYIVSGVSNLSPVKETAIWVTRMVQMFGLDSSPNHIGWTSSSSSSSGADKEALLAPYLRALSTFRDQIRTTAIQNLKSQTPETKMLAKTILAVSDDLRNKVLPELGVRLDDREGQAALIKMEDPEAIKAEMKEKEDKLAAKAAEKAKREAEAAAKEAERAERERIDPKVMFRTAEYEAWDEDGLPTRLKGGEELPKARGKKLRKEWERQKKAFEARMKKDEVERGRRLMEGDSSEEGPEGRRPMVGMMVVDGERTL